MNFKTISAAFLVVFWVCPFVLGAEPRVPEAIDRGMLFDGWQMQRQTLAPTQGGTTFTGSWTFQGSGTPPSPTRQHAINRAGWPFQADGEIFSFPCFDKDYMYFGACDGAFYCVDKKTAVVRWRKEGLKRVDSSPVLLEGTVFFAATDDTLYALKCKTGEVRWKASFPGIGYHCPKLLDKMVCIAAAGQLLGLDPSSGKVLRRYAPSGEGRDFDWNSKAIVVAVNRAVPTKDYGRKGAVICFDRDSAQPRWMTALGGSYVGNLVCDEENCYLGARDGFFCAIRMTDGKIIWRIDCRKLVSGGGSENELSRTVPIDDNFPIWADRYVIDNGGHVIFSAGTHSISEPSVLASADKKTGKLVWTVPHATEICGRFLIVDGILAAMAEDREMLLVRLADGKSVHFTPFPSVVDEGFFSGPRGEFAGIALDQGELFVVGADRHVWRLPWGSVTGTLDWPIAQPPDTPRSQSPPPKRPASAARPGDG